MSGFEKEELQTRAKGMTLEEQRVVAGTLPDNVLMEELCIRYTDLREKVDSISRAIGGAMEAENKER